MTTTPAHVPLVRTVRGATAECVHVGSIAIVDSGGRLIGAAGDPQAMHYTRSALKPLQALPFVEDGGLGRFGFGSHELAMMCASHNGEAVHVGIVDRMLQRIDADASLLQCGCHVPYFYAATSKTPPQGTWSALFHNCSGKHAGFLAYCRLHGHRVESYLDADSPLQTRIRNAVQSFSPGEPLPWGIDGCSAPNIAMPLVRLAQAFARIAADDAPATRALFEAMTRHPDLVSGTGRVDLALMRAGVRDGRPDWVSKIGADGVQAIGVRSLGIGIAVRIADGNARALNVATHATLQQLGLVDEARQEQLAATHSDFASRALRNLRGTEVGCLEALFALAPLRA